MIPYQRVSKIQKPKPTYKKIFLSFLIFQSAYLFAQFDSLSKLTFGGYAEIYYSYDFSNPSSHDKANFIYNHKRHNEINANLIVLKANYADKNSRANLGMMTGTYAQYNLSAEPTWAQFIYEANIGFKLTKNHNIWVDAGILPSHIGFESAISAHCWTLTRSILAENSPYYETGIKLSYANKKENLNLGFWILNGWQKVKKPDNIQNPSFGFQINFKPNEKLTLNYSNFVGTDKVDSINSIRTFHNFYIQYEPSSKIGILAGYDIGRDKFNTADYGIWYAPILILKYNWTKNINIAVRGEYYNDKNQIIIQTKTKNGFQTSGISTNIDYKFNNKMQCRIEGKMYKSIDKIFENNSNDNYSLTTNLTIKL
jgi:hypothetical protein